MFIHQFNNFYTDEIGIYSATFALIIFPGRYRKNKVGVFFSEEQCILNTAIKDLTLRYKRLQ